MSGSTGAERVRSREDFKIFLKSYERLLKKFPGFVSIAPSGSYNSDLSKNTFGDIDLITLIDGRGKDKKAVKKELAAFLAKLPDDVAVPFSSPRYNGKKFLNTGEIVTIRYQDPQLGYSVQVDNIIALDKTEARFKEKFLNFPAEKQGLILGLIKVATIETPLPKLLRTIGVDSSIADGLREDQEYEMNLSSIELQLRKVTYEGIGSFKQKSREIVWTSRDFSIIEKVLSKYDLDASFEDLLAQTKRNLKNQRSKNRIKGIFSSMISVKSGEVGTPKGNNKLAAIDKINKLMGEGVMSFKAFIGAMNEQNSNTCVFTFGRFQPPTIGHGLVVASVAKEAKQNGADGFVYVSNTKDKKKNPLDAKTKVDFLKKMFPKEKVEFVIADGDQRTPIEVAAALNKRYDNLIMVVGSDRVSVFERLLNQYNGKDFTYETITVVSAGERDPDSDSVDGMSGTKMRVAAVEDNLEDFMKGLPSHISETEAKKVMEKIKAGLGK